MRTSSLPSPSGFSLIEALIASVLVASALVGLAHLIVVGAQQALNSRRAASALTLAQSKLEHLRRVPWTYAPDGSRVSSTDLTESPALSLDEDAAGYVDYLDAFGEGVRPGSDAVPEYVRRWAILPLQPGSRDTLVLRVCVFTLVAGVPERTPAACVSAIRTRKP
jgi:hypothetical protein